MKPATLAERVLTLNETSVLALPPRLALVPNPSPAAQPLWEPSVAASSVPTTDQLRATSRPPELLPAEVEASIIAALTRPITPGEGHREGNDRRERELVELFVQLTPVQILDLRRRLANARFDDKLAHAFKRLIIERRQRLMSGLEDPRRRLARRS